MLKRIDILLKQDRKTFHTEDLSLLWNISIRNTLLTTIKRYTREKVLYRIFKGFYSTVPVEQLDPVALGISAIHDYAYLSTESVLIDHGILQQNFAYHTLISNNTRTFSILNHHYKVRKLRKEYLYNDTGIKYENGIRIATVERAVADLLYYNPKYYFDGMKRIDWKKVRDIQKEIGYK
ncbi:MAG: hypothetical protein KKA07_03255 [Bacteroidetes bacterium]|nr:hypothetical protein [Bacteroidota bacterium]MBU1718069.1 hypothetical protein [Bacteroidota bacterium]